MDNERSNGSTYYYDLDAGTCNSIDMHIGILTPDWLSSATFLGQQVVNGFTTDVWECGDAPQGYNGSFITYFADNATQRPVRWVFYDDASFDVGYLGLPSTASKKSDPKFALFASLSMPFAPLCLPVTMPLSFHRL